ncbi:MAG: cytochrome c biogenesis protein CcsA [Opitutus sp.]|nr:cytochrome c biogenesis protein CcsA [Opitutus sp.]
MSYVLTDRHWLWIAAEFYAVAFLVGTFSLMRGGKHAHTFTYVLTAIGYAIQLYGLGLRGRAVGGCPLGNTFEIFQFTAWSAISLYLLVGVRFRSSLLGYFTACLATALTLTSLLIPGWDEVRRANVFGGNAWIEFHAAIALFSYGVFALLALTSVMSLLRNYSLKAKNLGGWFAFLPSVIDLDHINLRLLVTGVLLMTLSLGVGAVWWVRDFSGVDSLKLTATIAVWLAYVVVLIFRIRGQLLSKRFAWTCVSLFALALLSLGAVDGSRHADKTSVTEGVSARP